MEDTLRASSNTQSAEVTRVLILVLMEDTLREKFGSKIQKPIRRLNPCFNGRYSQRRPQRNGVQKNSRVLILVLMEDTLRVLKAADIAARKVS